VTPCDPEIIADTPGRPSRVLPAGVADDASMLANTHEKKLTAHYLSTSLEPTHPSALLGDKSASFFVQCSQDVPAVGRHPELRLR